MAETSAAPAQPGTEVRHAMSLQHTPGGLPFGRHTYEVRLEHFAGPLDLLLYLVRRDEVNIYDIPIARITEQYLTYIADLSAVDIDRASEFLVMAATLLQIKARMLLPRPPAPEPEAALEEALDPRAELVAQLVAYSAYKEAVAELARREALQRHVWGRGFYAEEDGERPLSGVALPDLVTAFAEILREEWSWREVPREEIPLREKLREISFRLARHPQGVRFRDLFSRGGGRIELIVTFLAVLELIRQKRAVAEQSEAFGEIWVRRPLSAVIPAPPEEE